MASSAMQWSCRFCTLINKVADKRCAACDNERCNSSLDLQSPIPPVVLGKDLTLEVDKSSHLIDNLPRNDTDETGVLHQISEVSAHAMEYLEKSCIDRNAPSFRLLPTRFEVVPKPSSEQIAETHLKYVIPSNYTPIAGSSLSDSVESIISQSSTLQNQANDFTLFDHQSKPNNKSMHKESTVQVECSTTIFESNNTGKAIEWECSVCTNMNLSNCAKCELCDTERSKAQNGGKEESVVELTDSTNRTLLSTPRNKMNGGESHFVLSHRDKKGINTQGGAMKKQISSACRRRNRQSLRNDEFENFVSVGDLSSDPKCKVNYKAMFTDSTCTKSYMARFRKRVEESRSRQLAKCSRKRSSPSTRDTALPREVLAKLIDMADLGKRKRKSARKSKQMIEEINYYNRSIIQFEEAKAYLQTNSLNGTNLYEHLTNLLLKIVAERPENATEIFEYLSITARQEQFAPGSTVKYENKEKLEAKAHQALFGEVVAELQRLSDAGNENFGTDLHSKNSNILDQCDALEWAGVAFSKSEMFRVCLSTARIENVQNIRNLRIWGKILGLDGSFYVAEGQLIENAKSVDENEEGADGANKFTFWVMRDDGKYTWARLPNVTCNQILVARKLTRYIRGDLEGEVHGHPPFPGKEKNFLRAQIARISSSTSICPEGYLKIDESSNLEIDKDCEVKTCKELMSLGSWVHYTKHIDADTGRTTSLPKNDNDEELRSSDGDSVPFLRRLNEDSTGTWRVDSVPITPVPINCDKVIVKSLIWPGAVSVASGKFFCNIYVGYACKQNSELYQIQHPNNVEAGFGVTQREASSTDSTNEGVHFTNFGEQKDVLEDPVQDADSGS